MNRDKSANEALELDGVTAIDLAVKLSRFALAIEQHRSARGTERQGYPLTAAVQWRIAAEMFNDEAFLGERCWSEWERIMRISRRFAYLKANL